MARVFFPRAQRLPQLNQATVLHDLCKEKINARVQEFSFCSLCITKAMVCPDEIIDWCHNISNHISCVISELLLIGGEVIDFVG